MIRLLKQYAQNLRNFYREVFTRIFSKKDLTKGLKEFESGFFTYVIEMHWEVFKWCARLFAVWFGVLIVMICILTYPLYNIYQTISKYSKKSKSEADTLSEQIRRGEEIK